MSFKGFSSLPSLLQTQNLWVNLLNLLLQQRLSLRPLRMQTNRVAIVFVNPPTILTLEDNRHHWWRKGKDQKTVWSDLNKKKLMGGSWKPHSELDRCSSDFKDFQCCFSLQTDIQWFLLGANWVSLMQIQENSHGEFSVIMDRFLAVIYCYNSWKWK